jgi:hypothetical protein
MWCPQKDVLEQIKAVEDRIIRRDVQLEVGHI